MDNQQLTYFNWSSGKDASMALFELTQREDIVVNLLVTSTNKSLQRVTMHGLKNELLYAQASAIGLPLELIELPEEIDMQSYNSLMSNKVKSLVQRGYSHCGFGDIFLEDLKEYRVNQLETYGIKCLFPLWKRDTKTLIKAFIEKGFKAVTVCINSELLGDQFLGREIDESFINELPENVDPCGENGEFHTFCYDGPIFKQPVTFNKGEIIKKTYPNPTDSKKPGVTFGFIELF